jgi:DNA-binding transcriptional LysR family regulator
VLRTSLRYFVAVARHGSIRAACTELNVAQSAVSRQLQALEREIGSTLFERLPRGIALPPEGELLFAFGRDASSNLQGLTAGIAALRRVDRGHVRLAVIESMVPGVLPRALGQFLAKHPAITFAVEVTTTDQAVARVRAGGADVGIGFCPALDAEFDVAARSSEPLLAVMSRSHPLTGLPVMCIPDAARWPLALSPRDSGARVMFDRACACHGITVPAAFESNSLEMLHRFVEDGDGITVLLRHTVAASLQQRRVHAIPFREPQMAGSLEIFTLARRSVPVAAKRFTSALVQEIGADGAEPDRT